MNKRTTITLMTHLRWGAFFLVLLFLVIQVMPRALGQRGQQDISKRTSDIQAPSDPASGTWTATGSLNTGRFLHTATLLPNGMVLVAGGLDSNFHSSASAELYDPASGTWTTTGSLNTAPYEPTATLLSNGMVLVAAGGDSSFNASASAELYDPASGTWTATGSLNTARYGHSATSLSNGMVLVTGGFDGDGNASANAELYDPASGTWTVTGSLNTGRAGHTATLLLNAMVLVAGGLDGITVSPSAELYETSTSTPTPTPTPTPTATPTPTPTPGEITLNAVGHRVRGVHTVDLSWTGATSANIDVYRDGAVVATTANDGFYTDSIGTKGRATYTYKVCEAGTQTCSNEVTVRFGGPQ